MMDPTTTLDVPLSTFLSVLLLQGHRSVVCELDVSEEKTV